MTDSAASEGTAPRARSIEEFDASYAGTPPWDIGRAQPAFVGLAEGGSLRGRLLDVGCGTGEHVLMAARLGLTATGVDAAPTAIDLARRKAEERGLDARFIVADALDLAVIREDFDTVLDCWLFHVFDDEDRARFVTSLHGVVVPGGRYYMACFSDLEPGDWGPRRVREDEIRSTFSQGWQVASIEAATLDITIRTESAKAWLSTIVRS